MLQIKTKIFLKYKTVFIILIMRIGIKIDLRFLVLSSLIAMMEGKNLFPKLIYTLFLCLLTWTNKDNFYKNTFFTLLAALLVHFIPYNNIIHKTFSKNKH